MIQGKKILVTGGLGFIGFNTVKRFYRGNEICVIDDCSRRGVAHNIRNLKSMGAEFHQINIARKDRVRELYYSFQPDIVFHLAAQVAVTSSIDHPFRDFETNVAGSLNLLELARAASTKPMMVYASSNKVYGGSREVVTLEEGRYRIKGKNGYSEDEPLSFETPYGCSKGAADQYFIDYARTYNLPTVVFRQSCIYGPHQYGMEDQGWMAWFAICSVLERPVTIFGDGNQVRDVLFIDDLLDLYEMAILRFPAISGEVYNIGGGPENTLSLNELVRILNGNSKKPLDITHSEWRKCDQKVFVSDIGRIRDRLGWEPKTSPETGIRKLLDWIVKERKSIQEIRRDVENAEDEPDVTIVIPARNEEACLPSVLDELSLFLDNCEHRVEVIVVDDRSTDGTPQIAQKYPFLKLTPNRYPSGKGGALRSGFDLARGKLIAMMDADYSHRAFDLPNLLEEAFRTRGLVVASRITGGSEEYTRVRAFGNVFLTWFFGFLHGRYLSDILNGFKVFHRDVYHEFHYTSNGFEIEIELVVNALRLKRPVTEFPSRERPRLGGKMKSSVIRHGPRFFWQIFLEHFRTPRWKRTTRNPK